MPNEFVGAEQRVRGLNNAGWGTVAVLLRNGLPDRVITPGSRFARGFRAPLLGNVTLVPIQTDAVPIGFDIADATTADGYQIGLRLNTLIRINGASDYRHLTEFVQRHGRNFADALIQEIQRGLESWVTGRIGAELHAQLRRRPMSSVLDIDMPFTFGSNTLVVVSFTVGDVRWDAKAVELENVIKDRPIQVASAANDEHLSSYRLAIFTPLAAQLGVSAAELAFPERHQLTQQNAKELALELLKPHNRTLWQRDPTVLTNLFTAAGLPPAAMGTPGRQALAGPDDRSEPTLSLGTGAAGAYGSAAGAPTAAPSPEAVEDVNTDKRLLRFWLRSHQGTPVGIAGARTGSAAMVIIVRDTAPGAEPAPADDFVPYFSGLPVRLVELRSAPLSSLVGQWIDALFPDSGVTSSVRVDDDDVLYLGIGGTAATARDVIKRLDDPADPSLDALEALLSYAGIQLQLGSA